MIRVRCSLVLAMACVMVAALLSAAQAQAAEGRGGFVFFGRGGSLVGLLNLEQVQKELKLNEEQVGKVKEVGQKLAEEMRQQYAGLREIEDREKRMAKLTELSGQMDRKAMGQLRDVLSNEQRRRLFQIRTQVRGVVASLSQERTANRLKLTEEQKEKVAAIDKATQQKQREAFQGSADLSQEERRARFGEFRKIRQKADEEALALLTAEQKDAFAKMQGEKFELQPPSRQ